MTYLRQTTDDYPRVPLPSPKIPSCWIHARTLRRATFGSAPSAGRASERLPGAAKGQGRGVRQVSQAASGRRGRAAGAYADGVQGTAGLLSLYCVCIFPVSQVLSLNSVFNTFISMICISKLLCYYTHTLSALEYVVFYVHLLEIPCSCALVGILHERLQLFGSCILDATGPFHSAWLVWSCCV